MISVIRTLMKRHLRLMENFDLKMTLKVIGKCPTTILL